MSERIPDYPPDQLLVFDMSEGFVPATPAEIAKAHPKCETCGHREINDSEPMFPVSICMDPISRLWMEEIFDPTNDYCPHHTALTKLPGAPDETDFARNT